MKPEINRQDIRARKTDELVIAIFKNLMAVKPIDKITVREICEAARISRTAFYDHYFDIYHIQEIICEPIADNLCSLIAEKHDSSEEAFDFSVNFRNTIAVRSGETYSLPLPTNHEKYILTINKMAYEKVTAASPEMSERTRTQIRYFMDFISFGTIGIYNEWYNTDYRTDPLLEIMRALSINFNELISEMLKRTF